MVIDMSLFTGLSLELAYQEFRDKFTKSEKYSVFLASQSQGDVEMEESKEEKKAKPQYYKKGEIFPIIASECPGWVCYAEKRVGDLVEPNISKTKSP